MAGEKDGKEMTCRIRASVKGVVQGIGFRPFVYNLAKERNLVGHILNTSSGVNIEAEGRPEEISLFFQEIENNPLPLTMITQIEKTPVPPKQDRDFTIRKSISFSRKSALIPADISVCDKCLEEMTDSENRRYRYPFINCTHCGPRYTIIHDLPYDRPLTSMKVFRMCDDCLREYHDPGNRRFHAQPNACPACGPRLELRDRGGKLLETDDPVAKSIELLKKGHILAVKGLGGVHLAVDAENDRAVLAVRKRKGRDEKPFAVMSLNPSRIQKYAKMNQEEESLLLSAQRPIVILEKKVLNSLSSHIAPKNRSFGVMLPYTPLHYLFLQNDFLALVMTSGNLSEEPIIFRNDNAFERLGPVADYFLIHNRDIYCGCDDSIFRTIGSHPRIIRRARGFVPLPLILSRRFPSILACGAELKNTVCLTFEKNAFLSQHIGDLKNLESYRAFSFTIDHLKKLLDIEPEIVAHDLHPDYLSTRYALDEAKGEKAGIQHHHAHIVSCLTEHGLDGPVIGFAFDGAGYGTDGKTWGGEALLVNNHEFTRLAHLSYLPMPGGDAVIKEPWRMAISYLFQTFGEKLWDLKLPLLQTVEKKKIETIIQMIEKGVNCPETSSLGRLFDALSALLGVCLRVSYEGQAAIELEMIADGEEKGSYSFEWKKGKDSYVISPLPVISGVVDDILKGSSPPVISQKFHLTLIRLFSELGGQLKKEVGLDRIVLSGGVFQNATFLTGLEEALDQQGFSVFSQSKVPTNDGGISLGQAAIAASMANS